MKYEYADNSQMRHIFLAALFSFVFFVSSCSQRSNSNQDSFGAFTSHLDHHVPRLMNRYDIPGVSMALVQDGELIWSNAYGYADLENGRKMTVDVICRAESISKSVTAWGVMRLVEQGLIDLDAPVQQYLTRWEIPESEYFEQAITVRMLLSGSAGLPLGTIGKEVEYQPISDMPSLQDYLTRETRLIQEPGSGFMYSNVGFNLLELLIEDVTGRDFTEYMADEVLLPLDMHHSSFAWDESLGSSVPNGHELDGTAVPPYVYPVNASGGLFASVEDIARFVSAGMTGSYYVDHGALTQKGIRTLHTPQVDIPGMFGVVADSYGFGHFLESLPGGQQAIWHGGQGHGWMTHFHAVPESGDGIIILTNSQRSWPFIAEVLTDWAGWNGFGLVKFSRITYATTASWVFIGIVVLVSLWLVYRLVQGLHNGNRGFAPLSWISCGKRLLQIILGIGISAALAWRAAQPYRFESSIFPGTAGWAGISLLALAVILILSSLFSNTE